MRKEILSLLRERQPEPVSGKELAVRLGISRTAVWKHIQMLKGKGYEIESVPKKGYILRSVPDKLSPEEVEPQLKTKWVGRNILYKERIRSTNELAKACAQQDPDLPDGFTVVAEEQSSGHGRLTRGWFSPYGHGVWVSVVLKPPFMPQEAPKCTLLAAVACIKAINKYKGVDASIKWPNDVLLNGKKMVGILTEMSAEFGHINYIVIGTGINVNVPPEIIPDELKPLAISLQDAAEEKVKRVDVLADYLKNVEDLYEQVLEYGFKPVFDEWRRYTNTLGQAVKVIAPDETYTGTAIDIDEEGLLIVKKDDGVMTKVIAGDVSIRPAAAQDGKYA